MALNLITGKPGSYKSAYVMDIVLKSDKSRPIFLCNFKDLKIGKLQGEGYNASLLDSFEEWVNCPDGSLIFIDEIQEFTRHVQTKAKTEELPSHFTSLEKHRHRGIDIYIVTQHPMFIHTHLRRLLEKHIHMQRAIGLPYSNKREWHNVCNEPEDSRNATIQNGCTVEIYRPNKKVFEYYTSTVKDTHKFKIPKKLLTYGILLTAGFSLTAYFGYGFVSKYVFSDSPSVTSSPSSLDGPITSASSTSSNSSDSKFYAASRESIKVNPNEGMVFDPANPSEYKPIDSRLPVDFPRVKGVVIWQGKCHAFSQQGTPMEISQDVCFEYFEKRQFDYLKAPS